eukprot:4730555-Amphidinium_carterae.1
MASRIGHSHLAVPNYGVSTHASYGSRYHVRYAARSRKQTPNPGLISNMHIATNGHAVLLANDRSALRDWVVLSSWDMRMEFHENTSCTCRHEEQFQTMFSSSEV